MAADLASPMTIGLLAPLYRQMDPIRLAEVQRQVRVISDYGERIAKSNLKPGGLKRLLADYPSHDFVIDRSEIEELFEKVEEPTPELSRLYEPYERIADYYSGQPHDSNDERREAEPVNFGLRSSYRHESHAAGRGDSRVATLSAAPDAANGAVPNLAQKRP